MIDSIHLTTPLNCTTDSYNIYEELFFVGTESQSTPVMATLLPCV